LPGFIRSSGSNASFISPKARISSGPNIEGRAVEAVPGQQGAEIAEIAAEPLRRDRGVLPALVGLMLAGRVGGGPQAELADLVELVLYSRVLYVRHVRLRVVAVGLDRVDQARLVPPPRDSTGAPNSAHTPMAAAAASALRGTTTPSGG